MIIIIIYILRLLLNNTFQIISSLKMLFDIFINNYYTISTIYNNTILFKLEVMAAEYRYLAGSHFFLANQSK